MSTAIEFTGNYEDLSTDLGFQFKFHCQRCGSGYMSSYERNALGTAGTLLSGASRLLGGMLDRVADASYEIQRAVGSPAHDAALGRAVLEIRPRFQQCHHCGQWVCGGVCWNLQASLRKDCAPEAQEVEKRVRAQHVETQVANDLFLEENVRMSAKASEVAGTCVHCGTKTMGKRFCPGCGTPRQAAWRFCASCGTALPERLGQDA